MALDDEPHEALLTLHEAADRLKVHYMTAYRWVRRGDLPAFKAGGRLRVRAGDLRQFVEEREVDVALPSDEGQRTDWPVHVERLHILLAEGRAPEAGALVRKVMADGAPAGDVYVYLIAPALHRIGDDWAAGLLGVGDEHRATEIVLGIMTRLGEAFRRRGPARGSVVTVAAPGDLHAIGAAMAADFARAAGFDVHHLGGNMPLDELERFLGATDSDVLCVSVTNGETAPDYGRIVEVAQRAGVRDVVFGGQSATPEVGLLDGGHHVDSLRELGAFLQAQALPVPSG